MFWHLKETFTIIFITIFVTTKVADEVFPNLDLIFFQKFLIEVGWKTWASPLDRKEAENSGFGRTPFPELFRNAVLEPESNDAVAMRSHRRWRRRCWHRRWRRRRLHVLRQHPQRLVSLEHPWQDNVYAVNVVCRCRCRHEPSQSHQQWRHRQGQDSCRKNGPDAKGLQRAEARPDVNVHRLRRLWLLQPNPATLAEVQRHRHQLHRVTQELQLVEFSTRWISNFPNFRAFEFLLFRNLNFSIYKTRISITLLLFIFPVLPSRCKSQSLVSYRCEIGPRFCYKMNFFP